MTFSITGKLKHGTVKSSCDSEATLSADSSRVSAQEMEEIIEKLELKAYQDPTWQNYYTIWCLFNKFVISLNRKPNNWEDRLVLFIAKCVSNGRASAIIRSYASAVKAVLRTEGVFLDSYIYKLKVLAKVCRLSNDRLKIRLPIKKGLFGLILDKVEILFETQPYLTKLYKAIFASVIMACYILGN